MTASRRQNLPLALDRLAILILPLAFAAVQIAMREDALPYWLSINFDPAYAYLPSGLMILEGVPPALYQHPGTPVESLVALVTWAMGLGSPGAVSDAAFVQGEAILRATSDVIVALATLALVALGWTARRRIGALTPALLAQTAPFMTVLGLKHGTVPKPEPALLLAVVLLSIAMIEEWHRPRPATTLAMGFVAGFGVACKVTFAPLGLAPLILIVSWRRKIAYAILAALFFALWVSPAWSDFAKMGGWFGAIATHSGEYGRGAAEMLDPRRFVAGFVKLFFSRPLYLIVYGAGIAALLLRRRERTGQGVPMSLGERLLLGALVAQLLQMLMAAKQPSAHYVLPTLEWAGPTAAFVWIVARETEALGRARLPVRCGFIAFLALTLISQGWGAVRVDRELRTQSAASLAIDMDKVFPACARVYRNFASSPAEAWFYDLPYGAAHFAQRLAPLIPADDYFVIPWRDPAIHSWTGTVAPDELGARYPCIALRGVERDTIRAMGFAFGPKFDRGAICELGLERIALRYQASDAARFASLPPSCAPDTAPP